MESFVQKKSSEHEPSIKKDSLLWCLADASISSYVEEMISMKPRPEVETLSERSVHRFRVLCRKIRTSLNTYQNFFDRKIFRHYNKTFRKFARSFADIRDLDVLREELDSLLDQDLKDIKQEDLLYLISKVDEEHSLAMEKALPKVVQFFEKNYPDELKTFFDSQMTGKLEADVSDAVIRGHLLMKLRENIDQINLFNQDADKSTFHQLRIDLKHLRYSLDELHELHEPLFQALIDNLIPLQNQMGRIHDLEGWGERISTFKVLSSGGTDEGLLKNVSHTLSRYWEAEEKDQYRCFISNWNYLSDVGFWQVMEKSLTAIFCSKYA